MGRKSLVAVLLAFLGFPGIAHSMPISVDYIDSNGREWANLNDTLGLSGDQVRSVCPVDAPCSSTLLPRLAPFTPVNLGGWTWASETDVKDLFIEIGDLDLARRLELNIFGSIAGGLDSEWAPRMLERLTPIPSPNFYGPTGICGSEVVIETGPFGVPIPTVVTTPCWNIVEEGVWGLISTIDTDFLGQETYNAPYTTDYTLIPEDPCKGDLVDWHPKCFVSRANIATLLFGDVASIQTEGSAGETADQYKGVFLYRSGTDNPIPETGGGGGANPVPEPAIIWLFGIGLVGLIIGFSKRRKAV